MIALRVTALIMVAALAAAAINSPAFGHGVGWVREGNDGVVALRFVYSDGEPMMFADVTVTDPAGKVFQKARADREGRFAFVPSTNGEWRAKADDGTGHALEALVTVESGAKAPAAGDPVHTAAVVALPRSIAMLLGLSLIANLFGGLFLWRMRRGRRP